MSNRENIIADIKQILDTFDQFVNIYELESWIKNVEVEDVKNSFKLAAFVEETIKDLQTKQCLDLFKSILNNWWKKQNRSKVYDIPFFCIACDHLLSKFFTNGSVKVNTADIAVRMYTTIQPKDRFEKFISNLILKSSSYTALVDYTIANKDNGDLKELECRLLLRNWSTEVACGRVADVKTTIANMLLSYKIETSLSSLINILALENVSDQEKIIQDYILEDVLSKMIDRSILSKAFWLSLIKHVEKNRISIVCLKFNDFLKKLFNFIIYIGCMMNYQMHNCKLMWVSDSDSICPGVTYDDLVNLVKFLCNYKVDLKKYALSRIAEAKNSSSLKVWEQLEKDV